MSKLTVFFESPFWVGLYERQEGGRYEVSRIVFGPEPKDYEVLDFVLTNWHRLRFSPSVDAAEPEKRRVNPKRMQRMIQKQTHQETAVGTKAQMALSLQREQGKRERRTRSREQREADKEQRFVLREEKRRQKHRGH
jgi:hypothetical protein